MLKHSMWPEKSKSVMQLIFGCMSLMILLVACGGGNTFTAQNPIVYGLDLEPAGFDPHWHDSVQLENVLRQVYDTLVYRDPITSEFVPGLAQSWAISEDGRVYTFNLRDDVIFHDGFALNADAVAASLDRIISVTEQLTQMELPPSKARIMLGPYTGYRVVDAYTIELYLTEPYEPFLDVLSQVYMGIASPVAMDAYSINRYQYHQIGTGPYTFYEYIPGDRIVLRRNENYTWGPAFYNPPSSATPDEIIYRFFPDGETRVQALEGGDAQIISAISPIDARGLTGGESQVQLAPRGVPGQPLQFMINVNRYPTDNRIVRQALIYATNRTAIVGAVYQGLSSVAWGPLGEGTLFYTSDVVGRYDYNLQQARALLSSVGFIDDDANGFLDAGQGDLEVTIIVPPWGFAPEVAELIQAQWLDIGVRVNLKQVPNLAELRQEVSNGEYNLVAYDVRGFDPVLLNDFFITGAINNFSQYSNQELDNALRLAAQESRVGIRRELYRRIQVFIMDDALILPIREITVLNAATTDVQNLQFDRYGWATLIPNLSISG